jgi:hypothetical protein
MSAIRLCAWRSSGAPRAGAPATSSAAGHRVIRGAPGSRGHARYDRSLVETSSVRSSFATTTRDERSGARLLAVAIAVLALPVGGCSYSRQVALTSPPGVTQQLVYRSLERAVAQLDLAPFLGRRVALEVWTQAGQQPFVRERIAAWLEERGVHVTAAPDDLTLKVFASVLGTDRGETLIGVPALQLPVLAVPIPEIALFKWVRNRGTAEVEAYAFDGTSGTFVRKTEVGVAGAKHDDFTVLLVFSFTLSDTDERLGETRR